MVQKFVIPDVRVLTLPDGDTLVVKKRLTQGEKRAHFSRLYLAGVDGQLRVNPEMVGISTVLAYLLDWSLRDASGAPVPIRGLGVSELLLVLDSLDPDAYKDIERAIETHDEEMQVERDTQKKATAGELTSAATSPSPSAAGGALSGSAN